MKFIHKKYLPIIAWTWVGYLVLSLLLIISVLTPQKNCKKQLEKQLIEKEQTCNSLLKLTQKETVVQVNKQVSDLQDKLNSFVTDFGNLTDLTFDISQIADKKRVASFSIKTRDDHAGSALPNCNYLSETHIDITFMGSFNQFAGFLNDLERHKPVVFVNRFRITRSENSTSTHQVNMDLAVLVKKQLDS